MSLKRRVCQLGAAPSLDHIWISDDVLNYALNRFSHLRVSRRHGSSIPGPLEARKRAARRRLTDLASTGGGSNLHPGFLAGLNHGQDYEQGWQWQSPSTVKRQDAPKKHGNPALPSWLLDYEEPQQEHLQAQKQPESVTAKSPEKHEVVESTPPKAEMKNAESRSPEARLKDNNELDHFETVIGNLKEHDPSRKKCSRLALEQLLDSGCDMQEILAFWGDPILNPWSAGNLSFFVTHCGENSKIREMEELCKWMAHQLYLGLCPDRNLLQLLSDLSRLDYDYKWKEVLKGFCIQIVQGLKTSPVFGTPDLELETYSKLSQLLFNDALCSSAIHSGLDLVRMSSPEQFENSIELLSSTVQRWISSWPPSNDKEVSSSALEYPIGGLLALLPKRKLLEVIRAVNRQLFNRLDTNNSHSRQQMHLVWWSALCSSPAFKRIKRSRLWSEIDRARHKALKAAKQPSAVRKIKEALDKGILHDAYEIFKRDPRLPLEDCPQLAEALILSPGTEWRKVLRWREIRQDAMLASPQHPENDVIDEKLRNCRIELLERAASAYGQASHIPPHSAFRCAHQCWKLQNQENLGPIRPAMIRALTLCGIVRPLQAVHLVPRQRIEWILQQVAEVEGTEVAKRLGADVWKWRKQVKARLEEKRQEKLRENLAGRHEKQRERLREPNAWDRLTEMAQSKSTDPVRNNSAARVPFQKTPIIPTAPVVEAVHIPPPPMEKPFLLSDKGVKSRSESGTPMISIEPSSPVPAHPQTIDTNTAPPDEVTAPLSNVSERLCPPAPPSLSSSESMQYVIEYSLRDVAWNAFVRNLSLRSPYTSPTVSSEDTKADDPGFPSRRVIATDTRAEAIERHFRTRKLATLMKRLKDARPVSYDARDEEVATSLGSLGVEQGLSSLTVASQGGKPREMIRYTGGWSRQGMRDRLGPATLADALQVGSGGCLSVDKVMHAARKGERRLDLGVE
ncbi:MAG: hypothetical protein Q9222_004531 [Ikaeria aurantiellina]